MKYIQDNLTFHGHSYQKVLFIFYPFLSVFCEDQYKECTLRKYWKFSIDLKKFPVNVEVGKKLKTVYKNQENHILALWRCLTYKKCRESSLLGLKWD